VSEDPICGMKVDAATAQYKITHNGVTHYFCSQTCKSRFIEGLSTSSKKGWFTRFLERIAKANRAKYGDRSPSCCGR
jgi:YHS domain-containing protein